MLADFWLLDSLAFDLQSLVVSLNTQVSFSSFKCEYWVMSFTSIYYSEKKSQLHRIFCPLMMDVFDHEW